LSYHLRVVRDLPELGLLDGDLIIYDPADPVEPYTVHRALAFDPGAILNQYLEGALVPLDITPPHFLTARRSPSEPRVLHFPSAG